MLKLYEKVLFGVVGALMLIGVLYTGSQYARSQGTVLGPNISTISVGTSAVLAAYPSNPARRAITICNGSAANTVTFTFGTSVTPVSLTTGQVLLTNSGANINCYTSPLQILTGIGAQVNLIASGASTPVTVIEY